MDLQACDLSQGLHRSSLDATTPSLSPCLLIPSSSRLCLIILMPPHAEQRRPVPRASQDRRRRKPRRACCAARRYSVLSIPPRVPARPRRRAVVRAAPLVRVKVKITVIYAVCASLQRQHTAFLTVIFTLTRKRGAALSEVEFVERQECRIIH